MATTPNKQWNFAASMAFIVIACMNLAGLAALYFGKITFTEYMAALGAPNGAVIGWIAKLLISDSQPQS